jgi:NADPH:quinone reductase-like Zn-dependent oxidoreductase
MKAAVITKPGGTPLFADFGDPVPRVDEQLIFVTASALSHVTKSRASGSHHTSPGSLPAVVGIDGVGRTRDDRRVYFVLPTEPFGGMAERVAVRMDQCIPLPADVDDITAAAIAIPGMSSWAALKERAHLMAGENVLINGATGTSGRLAVQIAKYLGAKRVIARTQPSRLLDLQRSWRRRSRSSLATKASMSFSTICGDKAPKR